MAVAADGRFALLHSKPATLTGRENLRVIKFCNGELMGKKLKFTKFQLRTNVVKPNICMSLTADVAGEAKVSVLTFAFCAPTCLPYISLQMSTGTTMGHFLTSIVTS